MSNIIWLFHWIPQQQRYTTTAASTIAMLIIVACRVICVFLLFIGLPFYPFKLIPTLMVCLLLGNYQIGSLQVRTNHNTHAFFQFILFCLHFHTRANIVIIQLLLNSLLAMLMIMRYWHLLVLLEVHLVVLLTKSGMWQAYIILYVNCYLCCNNYQYIARVYSGFRSSSLSSQNTFISEDPTSPGAGGILLLFIMIIVILVSNIVLLLCLLLLLLLLL